MGERDNEKRAFEAVKKAMHANYKDTRGSREAINKKAREIAIKHERDNRR